MSHWLDQYVTDVLLREPSLAEENRQSDDINISERALVKRILITFTPELSIDDIFERLHQTLSQTFSSKHVSIYQVDIEAEKLHINVTHENQSGVIPMQLDDVATHVVPNDR